MFEAFKKRIQTAGEPRSKKHGLKEMPMIQENNDRGFVLKTPTRVWRPLPKKGHIVVPQGYYEVFGKGFSRFKATGQGPLVGQTLELRAVSKDGTEPRILML